MKKNYLSAALAVITAAALTASCDDSGKEPSGGSGAKEAYVLGATVTVGDNSANYLITTEDLTKGEETTVRNGTETDTGTYWIFYGEKYLYRLVYNQGNAGVSTSYLFNDKGYVSSRSNTYTIKRFTSYGIYNDNIITTSTGDLSDVHSVTDAYGEERPPKGFLINYIDVEKETIVSNTGEIWAEDYLGDGEYVTFAGIAQSGSRLFTAPIPMGMSHWGVVVNEDKIKYPELVKTEEGGTNSGKYYPGELQWTQYPDQAYVAIYPNKNFSNDDVKLIKTEKISYAAGRSASQYYQMIWTADNGDVYVFSPSYAKKMSDPLQRTKLPAGVVRIKSGADDFDSSYYFDIESKSGGRSFVRSWYISGDYFMLLMYDAPLDPDVTADANDLAIFNASTGEVNYVTGLPSDIAKIGTMPYFDKGVAYIPVLETGQDPAVYAIDAATATATKGVTVQSTDITAVGKLKYY